MNNSKALVRKALTGDTGAFESLVKIHYPSLAGYLFKMGFTIGETDKLAAETFIKAYDSLLRYEENQEFSSWLYGIAIRLMRKYRKRNRQKEISVDDIPEFLRASGTDAGRNSEVESLNSLLSGIHDDSRSMLILTCYNGFSLEETGKLYGMSAGSVKMIMSRTRELLMRDAGKPGGNKSTCGYSENSLVKYLYGELDPVEKKAFQSHLKNCLPCRIMLESDSVLIKRIKREIPSGDVPADAIMEQIDVNACKNRKPGFRDYFLPGAGLKKMWRVVTPAVLAVLLAAILAVPEIFSPLWGGIMSFFSTQGQVAAVQAEENENVSPVVFSKGTDLASGSSFVEELNEKGMGDIPWQVLYADPSQIFIRNSGAVAGIKDGSLYKLVDLEGLGLNNVKGSLATDFSFSPTGGFMLAGNSIYDENASGRSAGVYLFNTVNGDYYKISDSFYNQIAFSWSMGGNYLAYADSNNGKKVTVLDLRTLKPAEFATGTPVKSLCISNSGGLGLFTGDQVMMASAQDPAWKKETVRSEPFYMDCDSGSVWYVINGVITKHVMGNETDAAIKLDAPYGSDELSDTFITSYRTAGNFLAFRLKNGDAGLFNLRTAEVSYMSTNREVAPEYLPWFDATSSGKRLMFDNDGKFLILSGNDVTTAHIPGYDALKPFLTRWMDDQRVAYVRMVDEKAPMAGEFSIYSIDTVSGDIAEVFRSTGKDLALNTAEPGKGDSLSTKPGSAAETDALYETDKATGTRVESFVVTGCKVKSGPGDNYTDIGEVAANEVIIYSSRVVNGWCLAQKISGLLDYNDKLRNAFWIKADNVWLYDRYGLPAGVVTADEVKVSRVTLVKGNLIRLIMKGENQSFVIPDATDVNFGIAGWVDNSAFTQELSGVYYNQAYLKKGCAVFSEPDSQSEIVKDFTDFMAGSPRDVFVNLSGEPEGGYVYALLPGGMAGWVSEADLYLPGGGQGSSSPTGADESDLNGDGVSDKITFSTDGSSYALSVNDSSAVGSGEGVQPRIRLVDIDPSDGIIEAVVEENGPSDDYFSTFYFYDGMNLILMGKVQGLCGNSDAVAGDGTVRSQTRGNVLETWFYKSVYRLNSQHTLEQASQSFHQKTGYKDTAPLRLIIPELPFTVSPGEDSIAFVLKQGETVWFVGSDNSGWCLFETSDGKQGWLQVSGYQDIPLAGLTAPEVFEGLNSAD